MAEIATGQRFRDTQPTVFGQPAPEWIVDDVFIGTDGQEYAHLRSASNPQDRKTLSTAILSDKRRFSEIPAGPAP